MELSIVEITKKIAVLNPSISADWPSFVRWIASQLVKRDITIYWDRNYAGWSDAWGYHGKNNPKYWNHKKILTDAVPSTEIVGLFKAPPLSLPTDEAIVLRYSLIEMGLLVASQFDNSEPCHSIIQFRI